MMSLMTTLKTFFGGILIASGLTTTSCGAAAQLYATDSETQQLFILSTADGSSERVGSFGVSGSMASLAYDSRHDVFFGTTSDTEHLFSINRQTGSATLVGSLGVERMNSLAYDEINGILYGVSTLDSSLYNISPLTGQATRIGPVGVFGFAGTVTGLDFNPFNNTLYGCLALVGPGVGGIVTINTATGKGTLLAESRVFSSLAFHPDTGVLYCLDGGFGPVSGALYTVELTTGMATLVGQTGLGNNRGIDFVQVPEPAIIGVLSLALIGLVACRRRVSKWQESAADF
jgi:hypothetical protein